MSNHNILLTIDQLAEALNVSKNTIYYWTHTKQIPYLKLGRHLRFNLEEVQKYFQERTVKHEPDCMIKVPIVGIPASRRSLTIKKVRPGIPPNRRNNGYS